MKKLSCFFAAFLLVVTLFPPVFTQVKAETTGKWVLTNVEDKTEDDISSNDSESGTDWFMEWNSETKFSYERSNFGMDWYSEYKDETGSSRNEGKVTASFSVLPETINPNESITITANLGSSATLSDKSNINTDDTVKASVNCSKYILTGDTGDVVYEIPTYPDSPYEKAETMTVSLPEGNAEFDELSGTADTITFKFSLYNSEIGELATTYTYEWVGGSAPQESSDTIELKGLVRSVENKPMRWMKLEAYVYYGKDTYSGGEPDVKVEGATDHEGRYSLSIPLEEDSTEPVGIMLTGSLKCIYPYGGDKEVFYLVDMSDTYSKDSDTISVSTWLSVDPTEYKDTSPDKPISIYRLLAFYNLGLGAWSFDEMLEPDPVYHYNNVPEQAKLLENYSTLYTAAYDAWFFGAAVLGEESLSGEDIRIEVRWQGTPDDNVSHFDSEECCIRLEPTDSLRDDNSRFVILHEFGHAFDYITNGNEFRSASGYGEGDTNHGGYFNGSTADSYLEGFATFYAGMVQLYSGYPNPEKLSFIDLGTPGNYNIWSYNGKYEELAVATLLYNTTFLIEKIQDFWGVIDTARPNFYEYYTALSTYFAQESPQNVEKLKDYAFKGGLYLMPFGNSTYDAGEPYKDTNDNDTYDTNEEYGDLMFAVGEKGKIDPDTSLQEYDKNALVMGQSSDASRDRKTIQPATNSYLYLSGEDTDYVLVDILPNGETGSRSLIAVKDGKVLIGIPDRELTGKVTVSIPGGGTIYEGDIVQLQQRLTETVGQTVPLAEATVSTSDLASDGSEAVATYGNVSASGILTIPEMSLEELIVFSDAYNKDATLDEVVAELTSREPVSENQSNGMGVLIYIIGGIVLVLIAVAVILILRKRNKGTNIPPASGLDTQDDFEPDEVCSDTMPADDIDQPTRICQNCGSINKDGAAFCVSCGNKLDSNTYCVNCGKTLPEGTVFCNDCGAKQPSTDPLDK